MNTKIGLLKYTWAQQREDQKMCKSMLSDLEDDQADLVDVDAADQTTDGEEVVRKPKKKK